MNTLIIMLVVLVIGIGLGFSIGLSRLLRETATRMQRSNKPLGAPILIFGGCILMMIALGTTAYSGHFMLIAKQTTGTIVEIRENMNGDNGNAIYAPTFSFRDSSGVEHTVISALYSSHPLHRVGDPVPVLYDPAEPSNAKINAYPYLWLWPTLTGLLGVVNLSIGIFMIHRQRIWAFAKGLFTCTSLK